MPTGPRCTSTLIGIASCHPSTVPGSVHSVSPTHVYSRLDKPDQSPGAPLPGRASLNLLASSQTPQSRGSNCHTTYHPFSAFSNGRRIGGAQVSWVLTSTRTSSRRILLGLAIFKSGVRTPIGPSMGVLRTWARHFESRQQKGEKHSLHEA
jgi:hypothetical protein